MQADQAEHTRYLCKADSVGICQFRRIAQGPEEMSHLEGRADGQKHRRVSIRTPSLLRKVRASAASRFSMQFETDPVPTDATVNA